MSDTVTRELERAASTGDLDAAVRALAARAREGSELMAECGACGGRGWEPYKGLQGEKHWARLDYPCLDCGGKERFLRKPQRGTGRAEWPWRGNTGRLALAAYAGDEAARVVAPDHPGHPDFANAVWHNEARCREIIQRGDDGWCYCEFRPWTQGLSRWPREALVRAARAAAGAWVGDSPVRGHGALALAAVDAWLADPTDANRDACSRGLVGAQDPARMLANYIGGFTDTGDPRGRVHWRHVISESARLAGEQPVRAAIQAALVEWAVGS